MKKITHLSFFSLLGLLLIISSCKKDNPAGNPGSGNLDAGKSSISFNNTGSYAGGSSFSLSNSATNFAQTLSSGILRNISLSGTEISGINTRTVMITIITPADASTSAGNLTADLSLPNAATILPTITLTSANGATSGTSYGSESGSLTITRLTATEIEGTFTATVKDVNGTETLSLSNGTFAGKFN